MTHILVVHFKTSIHAITYTLIPNKQCRVREKCLNNSSCAVLEPKIEILCLNFKLKIAMYLRCAPHIDGLSKCCNTKNYCSKLYQYD